MTLELEENMFALRARDKIIQLILNDTDITDILKDCDNGINLTDEQLNISKRSLVYQTVSIYPSISVYLMGISFNRQPQEIERTIPKIFIDICYRDVDKRIAEDLCYELSYHIKKLLNENKALVLENFPNCGDIDIKDVEISKIDPRNPIFSCFVTMELEFFINS